MIRKVKKHLFFSLAICALMALSSCERETDTPPLKSLDPTLIPNTTIAELKALYTGSAFVTITEDLILDAVVVANDKSGNFYRQIIISDASGGIELKINETNLFENYPLGQKLYIRTRGLILGSYGGIIQLGGTTYESNGLRLGGIEPASLTEHLFRLPGGQLPQPTTITLGENIDSLIYTAVKLTNVQFSATALNSTFAEPNQTTNRTLTDCQGRTIIVRTSGFADFAANTLPEGNGTITGILTKFVKDYQLIINDYAGIDMNDTRCDVEGAPKGNGTYATPFNVAAAYANNTGTAVWVQGYLIGVRETDVEPFVNNFTGPFRTNSNVIIADSPDETAATKILIVQLPSGAVRTAVNLVSNSTLKGKMVKLRGNLTAYFSAPGLKDTYQYWMEGMPDPDPDPAPVATVFEENFASSLGSFTDHNIVGEQKWGVVNYDGGAASMNGFASGKSNANENWLVSPAISLAGKTNAGMELREAINYLTNISDLKVLVSVNYNGSNPTTSGDWVELTGFKRPAGNNWTFVDSGPISLTQYEGQTIHIAFKYTSSTSGASAWQISKVKVFSDL